MTAYDHNNNRIFYLKLINFCNNKNGKFLSLLETHSLICNKNHKINYMHDAMNDVKLPKCIFNFYQKNTNFILC